MEENEKEEKAELRGPAAARTAQTEKAAKEAARTAKAAKEKRHATATGVRNQDTSKRYAAPSWQANPRP